MSARRPKTSKPRVRRSSAEINAALGRVIRHLDEAAQRFDAGDTDEAFTLAVLLRSILHYGSSPPLLHHAGLIKTLAFVDTGPEQSGIKNVLSGGLVCWESTLNLDGTAAGSVLPKLHGGGQRPQRYTPWWKDDLVILDGLGKWHTRKFIVTEMANTDAAHFDPFVDVDYYALTSNNGGWSAMRSDGAQVPVDGDIASASVRQIAWEVQATVASVLL